MVFQYQVWGSSGVMLRVWREASQERKALWVIAEDQGKEWREGRIILPSYDMEYRVRCPQQSPNAVVCSQGLIVIRECG